MVIIVVLIVVGQFQINDWRFVAAGPEKYFTFLGAQVWNELPSWQNAWFSDIWLGLLNTLLDKNINFLQYFDFNGFHA